MSLKQFLSQDNNKKVYVKIINKKSKKVLSVKEGSFGDKANVEQWEYSGYRSQLWYMEEFKDDQIIIRNLKSDKALDLDYGLHDSFTNIQQL